jgi:EAL domain-containing protein (putative c-di-GMP-specific phosphodiesterase class I)
VAEFPFARSGIQQNLDAAKSRLYLLSVAGALIMFLAILPLLARLADRIPLPADPVRRRLLAELRTALSRREFVVHYQPKVEIASGALAGVEALVRWNHPRQGLLPPSRFLPAAASSPQLLTGLTCQVLETAARDCAAWLEAGHPLPVAVNVAPATLLDPALVRMVQQTLDRHGLDPRMLTVELTENALMEPGSDVTAPLHELRALGLSVSIDDFGTGNSSLARLRTLPLDEIKIDRSLIASIATDDRDLGIARHIVRLGMDLGLRVVAEESRTSVRCASCEASTARSLRGSTCPNRFRRKSFAPGSGETPRASPSALGVNFDGHEAVALPVDDPPGVVLAPVN